MRWPGVGAVVAGLGMSLLVAQLHAQRRETDPVAEVAAIRQVVADMQQAWNRGDYPGYMRGFLNPGVVFVSRGRLQKDWQGTLDHYVRDYGDSPASRGVLCFYDVQVQMLATDAAQLLSRYRLDRRTQPQYGINTRLMRKVRGRWVIALNHVSSVPEPDPQATVPPECPGIGR